MGEFTLPVAPVALTAILGLLAPYVIAIVNRPQWSPNAKRIVSVLATVSLTVVALVLFYAVTKEPVPEWPQLVLLAIVVSQAAYALIAKPTATALESRSEEWLHKTTKVTFPSGEQTWMTRAAYRAYLQSLADDADRANAERD